MSSGATSVVRACTDRKTVTASVEWSATRLRAVSRALPRAFARMDPMAPDEPRSPLLDADPVHAS